MEQNYSLEALLGYCDNLCEVDPSLKSKYKGWMTAVRSVFSPLTEAQKADVRVIDIPTAVELYAGQNSPKPKTKKEYLGRAKAAVTSFLKSLEHGGQESSAPQEEPTETLKVRIREKVVSEANTFTVPIRKDFLAQFILPIDLTQDEAKRVCKLIEVLPLG